MKKTVLKISKTLLSSVFVLLSISQSQAQFGNIGNIGNLGNLDLNALANLQEQISTYESQSDAIQTEIAKTLSDSSIVDYKVLDSLQTEINNLQLTEDSIANLLTEEGLTEDSIAALQAQLLDLSTKQDSLSDVANGLTGMNVDSLLAVQTQLEENQAMIDQYSSQISTMDLSKFNNDSISKYSAEIAEMQKMLSELALGVDDETVSQFISVYPNPTSEYFVVNNVGLIEFVKVFDLSGNEISVSNNSGKYDVNNLSTGFYSVLVKTNKGSLATKLQVVK